MKYGGFVPAIDPGCRRDPMDVQVATYDDIRRQLRTARESLLLTIREVEDIAGLEPDPLAKVERDGTKKIPNVQTLSDWAGSLGFEIVQRPILLASENAPSSKNDRDDNASFKHMPKVVSAP